jgi:hypothetical protein
VSVPRVALVDHQGIAQELAGAVAGAEIVAPRAGRLFDALLQRRGFVVPLAHVPLTAAGLIAGRYDIAHAFSPQDALAALLWRRGPVVFTCTEVLDRDRLADRRLRLTALSRAVEESDVVIASSEESAAALSRWLAVEALVIAPDDAVAHERLYGNLLVRRG